MKNFFMVALLMGLSGTAFGVHAKTNTLQIETKNLPPSLQGLVKEIQSGKLKDVPPYPDLKSFLDKSTPDIQGLQDQLNALLKEKGYLVGSSVAVLAQDLLTQARNDIKALRAVEDLTQPIATTEGGVPGLIEYLKTVTPPGGFPFACYNYSGTKLTGIVTTLNGKLRFLHSPYNETDYVGFLSDIHDVGLINSGKEYVVSRTHNGTVQDAWLGTDPTTQRNVVVCMGHPYKPSTNLRPPAKVRKSPR